MERGPVALPQARNLRFFAPTEVDVRFAMRFFPLTGMPTIELLFAMEVQPSVITDSLYVLRVIERKEKNEYG
jgi:hypothetical protein